MIDTRSARGPTSPAVSASLLYRAVWRWHFYAGLLTIPFMLLLATTGGIYLFHHEIDGLLYRSVQTVPARATPLLAPSALVERALAAHPGTTATRFTPPTSPSAAAEVVVKRSAEEEGTSVFLDPHDGRVLGDLPYKGTAMWVVRRLHSLAFFGTAPTYVIEIVGGWAIVLVATGFYLWWPRSARTGGVVTVRGTPRRRVFWRDLHAVSGAVAGLVIGFLALTGMPWSAFWGQQVNRLATAAGLGYPTGLYDDMPMSAMPAKDAMGQVGWTMQNVPMPMSAPAAAGPIGLDAAVASFDRLGMPKGYAIDLPDGPSGVYTASVFPDSVRQQRVIHLDQYAGRPLLDVGLKDYGGVARAIEWGISIHMGQEFGLLNQLLMLAACIAIVVMAVAAIVMWWKRRPAGSLGAPSLPDDPALVRSVLAIMVAVGLIFPLMGLSLLAALAVDWLGGRLLATARPA